jgi:hypothetical protein
MQGRNRGRGCEWRRRRRSYGNDERNQQRRFRWRGRCFCVIWRSAATGGKAGAASSNLTFDDTKNAVHSFMVIGSLIADGDSGGAEKVARAGAAGRSAITLTAANNLTTYATATGGNGGAVRSGYVNTGAP